MRSKLTREGFSSVSHFMSDELFKTASTSTSLSPSTNVRFRNEPRRASTAHLRCRLQRAAGVDATPDALRIPIIADELSRRVRSLAHRTPADVRQRPSRHAR